MTLAKMLGIVYENKSGMIIALRDPNLTLRYCDKVVMLREGEAYAFGTPDEILTPKAIRDVYGVEAEVIKNELKISYCSYNPAGVCCFHRLCRN